MTNSAMVSTFAANVQGNSNFIGATVEEMKRMSNVDLEELVKTLVEQNENTRFKLGYALSLLEKRARNSASYYEVLRGLPSHLRRSVDGLKSNSFRLVGSKIPYCRLSGIPWSRLNHMAEFIESENLTHVLTMARTGTFAEFIKQTALVRKSLYR